MARPSNKPQENREGPRVNEEIDNPEVRFINAEGENVGVVKTEVALDSAAEAGLDLIEVSPNANPPVCKALDYGKYKYEAQKKKTEARKKQKTINIKEVKVRPNIEEHDYEVKARSIKKFLENGDKVKITLRFRGRELAHQNLGKDLLNRICEEFDELAKVEQFPKMEGRQMIMVLVPR